MKTRNTKAKQIESLKLQFAVALSLGVCIKVFALIFQMSTVQASTILKALN